MNIWYLTCEISQEYAIVFANNENEAFEKLKLQRKIDETNIECWNIEQFTEEKYNGVLYFC